MLSDKIKEIRRVNYLNQSQFAKMIGVTQSSVSQWEHDLTRPNSDQLTSISNVFHISVDDLLRSETQIEKTNNAPRTQEARIVSEAIDKMPQADREKAINLLKAVYSQYFNSAEERDA